MGDPNFDVSQLTGRAQTLWQKCDEKLAAYRTQCTQYGCVQMPAGLFPGQGEVEGIYDNWLDIPSAADFKWATDGLHTAMSKLTGSGFSADDSGGDRLIPANGDLVLVSTAGDELENWTGAAATKFKENYGDRFLPAAASQFQAYYLAREAINAEAAVWQEVRKTLDDLSNDAIHQMDQVGDCSTDDWKLGLEILAAVIAVAAAVPTGGGSVAAAGAAAAAFDGWAVVGAGVTVVQTGMDAVQAATAPEPKGLANGSPMQVISSLEQSLADLNTHVGEQEDKITTHVNDYTSNIGAQWASFCLPRPDLADVTRQTDDKQLGHAY